MTAGVGAQERRLPVGIFEISVALLHRQNSLSSLMPPPLQDGSASGKLSYARQSAVSLSTHRRNQGPAGNMRTGSGQSPRCAERLARNGSPVPLATAMN